MSDEKPAYPSRTADQFVVRFPDGMRDRLREAARANGRSMNAEIVARLELSFPQQQYELFTSAEIMKYRGLVEEATLAFREHIVQAVKEQAAKEQQGEEEQDKDKS